MKLRFIFKQKYILLFLYYSAFIIRFYSVTTVPLLFEETDILYLTSKMRSIIEYFLSSNIDLVETIIQISIVKYGSFLLGATGLRCLFTIAGLLNIYIIYLIAREFLGEKQALLSFAMLTFSQVHIGFSRLIISDILLLLFTSISLYLFLMALKFKNNIWVLLTGSSLGIGYNVKQTIVLTTFSLFCFLIIKKEYRFWFKRKIFYLSGLLMLLFSSPQILCNIYNGFHKFKDEASLNFVISLRTLYLFFGETLVWFSDRFSFLNEDLDSLNLKMLFINGSPQLLYDPSNEFPVMHWIFSLIIVICFIIAICKIKIQNDTIKTCLLTFVIIIFFTTFFGSRSTLLDDHWWALPALLPSVLFSSDVIIKFCERRKWFKYLPVFLITYLFINSLLFINITENKFAAIKSDFCRHYQKRALFYSRNKMIKKSIICNEIYKRKCTDVK